MTKDKNQTLRTESISVFLRTKKDTYLKMISYIRKLLAVFFGSDFDLTKKAEGIMNEIFGDLIDGTRAWNMGSCNLEQVLWMDIKSEVSNFIKKEKRFVIASCGSSGDENGDGNIEMDSLINTLPEDIEGGIDADYIENYCRDEILKNDEDAQIVFNEMLIGKKQKQIAGYLGLPENKTENIIRKIRRTISKQIPFCLLENLPPDLKDKILKYS